MIDDFEKQNYCIVLCSNTYLISEGLHNLTYARHLWPFSSEGSLACHTYYNTYGAYIYNEHIRGPVTLTPNAERLTVERSLPVLLNKVCCS